VKRELHSKYIAMVVGTASTHARTVVNKTENDLDRTNNVDIFFDHRDISQSSGD
jgi:hypothetical protein